MIKKRADASDTGPPPERRQAFSPEQAAIDSYGKGGFRFADMSHKGALLCLPSGIYGWDAAGINDVTAESLGLVFAEAAVLEVLLLGTGTTQIFPGPSVMARLQEAGFGFEIMDTGAAARTYNVLLAEKRRVAAALLPVD